MRVITFEWIRLSRYRSFWTLTSMYLLLMLLCAWMGSRLVETLFSQVTLPGMGDLSGEQAAGLLIYFSGYFENLLAFILILFVTNEFQLGTLKQHVMDGFSFIDVTIGRLVQVSILCGLSLFFIVVLISLFAAPDGKFWLVFPENKFMFALVLRTFCNLSLAMLFVSWIPKAIPAVIMLLAYGWILEPTGAYIIQYFTSWDVGMYLPSEVFSNLVPSPQKYFSIGSFIGSDTPNFFPEIAGLYFIFIWVGIYFSLKFRDI